MMGRMDEYDCRKCGACCSFKWSWPVLRRDRSDAVGIPSGMLLPNLLLLRSCRGRCVALHGTVGLAVACSIYENRPQACKRFVPGGMLCLEAREKFQLNKPTK